jgi:hypothetical protein
MAVLTLRLDDGSYVPGKCDFLSRGDRHNEEYPSRGADETEPSLSFHDPLSLLAHTGN